MNFDMRDFPGSAGLIAGKVADVVVTWLFDNWFKVIIIVFGIRVLQLAEHFDWNFGALAVMIAHFLEGIKA